MHMDDLGLVPYYVVKHTEPYLKAKYGSSTGQHLLDELNHRMRLIPRAEGDFSMPYCGGKYFCDFSGVQAKEHRNVLQVLPFLFKGIDEDLVDLCCW